MPTAQTVPIARSRTLNLPWRPVSPSEPAHLLVIDTSTPRACLAIATADGRVFGMEPDPSERHGRALIPAIEKILSQAGLTVADLDGFVVGLGPGSYTGLRIGLTAGKTLAYATGKPLAGFDSLHAIARNAPADALNVFVIADAQRGDVYASSCTRVAAGCPLLATGPTRIVSFTEWLSGLSEDAFVLGPSAASGRLADLLPPSVRCPEDPRDHWPSPLPMVELARALWQSGHRDDPWFLEPVYLRRSAAEDLWEAKGKR